jgi:hypothetical protein
MEKIDDVLVTISKVELAEKDDEIYLLRKKIELYEKKLNENRSKIYKSSGKKSRREEIIEYLESHVDSLNLNHKVNDEVLLHDIKQMVQSFKNGNYKYLRTYS